MKNIVRLLSGPVSPYVRVVRTQIAVCGLAEQIEIEFVATRTPGSPVHEFNPTGKIPTLVLDDGTALSETRLICEYLDTLHDGPAFAPVLRTLTQRSFEGVVTGFLDGVAVWIREARRAPTEQSPGILGQEQARAHRCMAFFEAHPELLTAPTNYVMSCLMIGLWRLRYSIGEFDWPSMYPLLAKWFQQAEATPQFLSSSTETN